MSSNLNGFEFYVYSTNAFKRFDLEGCLSFLSALASICLILSLVTSKSWPTSSRVWSLFSPMPKRMRRTFSSRGVSVARTFRVCSAKLTDITASDGDVTLLSSMKSPKCESSSSPIGVSRLMGSLAIFKTFRTFSRGNSIRSAISSGIGSLPNS